VNRRIMPTLRPNNPRELLRLIVFSVPDFNWPGLMLRNRGSALRASQILDQPAPRILRPEAGKPASITGGLYLCKRDWTICQPHSGQDLIAA
jgi:hypothetical protein